MANILPELLLDILLISGRYVRLNPYLTIKLEYKITNAQDHSLDTANCRLLISCSRSTLVPGTRVRLINIRSGNVYLSISARYK